MSACVYCNKTISHRTKSDISLWRSLIFSGDIVIFTVGDVTSKMCFKLEETDLKILKWLRRKIQLHRYTIRQAEKKQPVTSPISCFNSCCRWWFYRKYVFAVWRWFFFQNKYTNKNINYQISNQNDFGAELRILPLKVKSYKVLNNNSNWQVSMCKFITKTYSNRIFSLYCRWRFYFKWIVFRFDLNKNKGNK